MSSCALDKSSLSIERVKAIMPRVLKYNTYPEIPRKFLRPFQVNARKHGLSQQGVWVLFWTPKPLKRTPQDTPKKLCGISKYLNLKLIIEFFHLLIIPMTLCNDIMPYYDEFIHDYG